MTVGGIYSLMPIFNSLISVSDQSSSTCLLLDVLLLDLFLMHTYTCMYDLNKKHACMLYELAKHLTYQWILGILEITNSTGIILYFGTHWEHEWICMYQLIAVDHYANDLLYNLSVYGVPPTFLWDCLSWWWNKNGKYLFLHNHLQGFFFIWKYFL